MLFRQLFDPESSTYTYVLGDPVAREAVVVDPVLENSARDFEVIAALGLKLVWILDTHVHADHETGANALKAAIGGCTAVGAACRSTGHDMELTDGQKLPLGNQFIDVIATPGHTPGSMSFRFGDDLFTGDSLLIEGCGRTDFQEGDAAALYDSITTRLFTLPDSTRVWPGHDYKGRASSTIGHEKRCNPRLAGKSREAFADIMAHLGLAPPARLAQAVPANRLGGALAPGADAPNMIAAAAFDATFDPHADALADLRDPADALADKVPYAVIVDRNDLDRLTSLAQQHRRLFLLCRSGRRSLITAAALRGAGVPNAINITGGRQSQIMAAQAGGAA